MGADMKPWGYQWRSSKRFVMATTAVTLLSDVFLHEFMVSILPFILENRLFLKSSLAQKVSLTLMAQSALVSFMLTPVLGHMDHGSSAKECLVFGLIAELLGSVVIALAKSLPILFFGRFIQSLANTIVGVVGFKNLCGNTSADERGNIYKITTAAVAAGSAGGPLVAGVLFQEFGYWPAWSFAIIASFIGIILQTLMVKPEQDSETKTQPIEPPQATEENADEETPLLSSPKKAIGGWKKRLAFLNGAAWEVYCLLLSNGRFIGGMISGFCYAIISASFATTLPLHVQKVFNWGSLSTGILFAAIQGPSMALSVPIHWLKCRVGSKYLTAISFIAIAPLLWLLGTPGDKRFPWANEFNHGPVIYAAAIAGIGCLIPFLNGSGMMEATNAVHEIEAERPEICQDDKTYSRAVQLSRLSSSLGLFLGPILSGFLTEKVGYYEMTNTLAGICIFCALIAFWGLGSSTPQRPTTRSPRICGAEE